MILEWVKGSGKWEGPGSQGSAGRKEIWARPQERFGGRTGARKSRRLEPEIHEHIQKGKSESGRTELVCAPRRPKPQNAALAPIFVLPNASSRPTRKVGAIGERGHLAVGRWIIIIKVINYKSQLKMAEQVSAFSR